MKTFWVGGKNTVLSIAKNNKRKIKQLVYLKKIDELKNIEKKFIQKEVSVNFFKKIFKDQNFNHQNIAIEIYDNERLNLKNEINNLKKILILDNITDPRNVGSIIRTSVAFGIEAIIVQKKHFNSQSKYMFKTASGATEKIKIFEETNLSNSLKLLKKNYFWTYAFDNNAKNSLNFNSTIEKKYALIFGSEDKGISRLLLEISDEILKIEINKNIESLNVSNAVAATLAIINMKNSNT
jgi:23S rRNA (guanosine2251-2'-O)-methyltransferase